MQVYAWAAVRPPHPEMGLRNQDAQPVVLLLPAARW